ncbi:unnamed protein product [Mytilus edulis]|uniref:BTB domain-containing protein n=1 Tax=Mytilus edulis TaxID=6550 RepID=A0A8S3RV57_MYTED|nr:unnamed protein product [Mytilus edulis]
MERSESNTQLIPNEEEKGYTNVNHSAKTEYSHFLCFDVLKNLIIKVLYNIILKKQRELEFAAKNPKVQKQNKHRTHKTDHHLTIPVSKYLLEDFQKIVEYLHCGTVDISASNVAGLLCGASQFELGDLRTACLDYIDHCSRIETVITRTLYWFKIHF